MKSLIVRTCDQVMIPSTPATKFFRMIAIKNLKECPLITHGWVKRHEAAKNKIALEAS
jgi:hypothetical protein